MPLLWLMEQIKAMPDMWQDMYKLWKLKHLKQVSSSVVRFPNQDKQKDKDEHLMKHTRVMMSHGKDQMM